MRTIGPRRPARWAFHHHRNPTAATATTRDATAIASVRDRRGGDCGEGGTRAPRFVTQSQYNRPAMPPSFLAFILALLVLAPAPVVFAQPATAAAAGAAAGFDLERLSQVDAVI